MVQGDFLLEVWAVRDDGVRVYPYRGVRGAKTGLFSVSWSGNTDEFVGVTAEELVAGIESEAFCQRGTVRMLPLDTKPGDERSAYLPTHLRGLPIRRHFCR